MPIHYTSLYYILQGNSLDLWPFINGHISCTYYSSGHFNIRSKSCVDKIFNLVNEKIRYIIYNTAFYTIGSKLESMRAWPKFRCKSCPDARTGQTPIKSVNK